MNNYLFRNTAKGKGRFTCITPDNSPLQVLSYGRIILDKERREISENSDGQEMALICLKGEGVVVLNSVKYKIKPYDTIYIPPHTQFNVSTARQLDLAESSAPSEKKVDPQFISFEEVKNDPNLHMIAGKDTYSREIYKLIDTNVPAARLLCGVTFGKLGNWTSWAPHEHSKSKEEVYLYIKMPKPVFGIQLMYDDEGKFNFIERVFEDDAVAITKGYHPNVGIPGNGINFIWMMAALRADVDRDWTDMHFQKPFAEKY